MQTKRTYGDWRTSRHSGSSANCVEVAAAGGAVGVRDTKLYGHGPVLEFTGSRWRTFIRAAKNGVYDR